LDSRLETGYYQAMKVARSRSSLPPKLNLRSESITLSRAKTYLGRLVDKAMKGEPVYIVRGQQRFVLQHVPDIEPIPMRPPGFFANGDSRADIDLINRLSKTSVIRAPKDLE
jgi:hypothetical protein